MKLKKGIILGAMLIVIALTGCSTTEDSNEETDEVKIMYSNWVTGEFDKYECKTKGEVEKDTIRKNNCNSDATIEEVEELLNKFLEQADYYEKNKFVTDTFAMSGHAISITFNYIYRDDAENCDGGIMQEEMEELGEYLKDKYAEENIYIDTINITVRDAGEDLLSMFIY